MESAITCLVYALLLCAFNKIVVETPDVLLVLCYHWMHGMFSDVTYSTYRSSSPEVLVWMSSGLGLGSPWQL